MEVGLGLHDIVFNVDAATSRKKGHTHSHPIFGPCPLWPNGWMDEDAAWYKVGLGSGHIVLDGVPAPAKGAQHPPLFGPCLLWPRSPISATAQLLFYFFMAALCSRCGHYIFILWFLLSFFFSSPNLSRPRLDVYHTSTHVVALVRI